METIIVEGKYVATIDPTRRIIQDGAVVIENDKIIDVGKSHDMRRKHKGDRILEGPHHMVMPGFVDVHTHLFQCLSRGFGENLTSEEWLFKCTLGMAKCMKREDFMWAAKLNTLEMIKSGTTNFADSHFIHIDKQSIDNIVKGVLKTGIRATIVRSTQNRYQPEEFLEDIGTAKRETRRVYDQYNGAEGRITVVPEILTVIEADEEFIIEMKALALELGNGLHMHVAEHWDEYVYIKNKISSGLGEIEYIDKLGLLNDKFLMAHVVWATPKEILLIKKADAKVAHNAVTNQRGNDGVAPVPLMRTLGITVGIGCDGASSNNDQDMIKAMKMCAMMHKLHNCNSAIIDAEDVVEMATIDGARALRMGDKVGSIEMGKKADLIVIDLKKPHLTPCARPISNLVYSANGSDVVTTIVDGKIIMENRVVKTVDEEEIIEKASSITKRLVEESGINVFAARDRFKVC